MENIESKNNGEPITFFEITTAAALIAFNKFRSDINIIETGLGGRLDATNIIEKKKLCIITKIGLDHTEFLGKEIENIAYEKSGIFRRNTPIIIAKQDNKKALQTLLKSASNIGAKVIDIKKIPTYIEIGLNGNHQYENASTAYTAAKELLPFISENKARESLKKVSWHGRLEKLDKGEITKYRNNITILDGSHNQDGAGALKKYLNETPMLKWNLIIGMLKNRDIKDFVKIFKDHINKVYAIEIPNADSSYKPEDILPKLLSLGLQTYPTSSLEEALKRSDKENPLLITGSLYLVGHVLEFNRTKII